MFRFFGCEVRGNLSSPARKEPTPLAPEGEVLTTGPPGKSPDWSFRVISELRRNCHVSSNRFLFISFLYLFIYFFSPRPYLLVFVEREMRRAEKGGNHIP